MEPILKGLQHESPMPCQITAGMVSFVAAKPQVRTEAKKVAKQNVNFPILLLVRTPNQPTKPNVFSKPARKHRQSEISSGAPCSPDGETQVLQSSSQSLLIKSCEGAVPRWTPVQHHNFFNVLWVWHPCHQWHRGHIGNATGVLVELQVDVSILTPGR